MRQLLIISPAFQYSTRIFLSMHPEKLQKL